MKESELKQLVNECISEVIKENEMDEGFMDTIRAFGQKKADDIGNAVKTHVDKTKADWQQAKKTGANQKLEKLKKSMVVKLEKTLMEMYKEGTAAGLERKEVVAAMRSAITGFFNRQSKKPSTSAVKYDAVAQE